MADYKNILDFIHQVYQTENFVPLSVPKFIGNEKAYLNECIDTTFVSSVGKFVDRFEEDMARYTGAKKAVVCVSGTNALHMAMVLVGVERDDEVLTQALTFIANCNAISYIGAHPVFIDVILVANLHNFLNANRMTEGMHRHATFDSATGSFVEALTISYLCIL